MALRDSGRGAWRVGARMASAAALCTFAASILPFCSAHAQTVVTERKTVRFPPGRGKAVFDVTRHTISLGDIEDSVPRDSIPTLTSPRFLQVKEVRKLLKDSDRVLGIFLNGEAKAYPLRILNWHELVNDTVGGRAALVSW